MELLLTTRGGWEESAELAERIALGLPAGGALAPGGGAPAGPARGGARAERSRAAGRGGGAAARRRRPGRVRAGAAAARPAHAGRRRRLLGASADRRSDRLPAHARQPAGRAGAVLGARLAAGGPQPRRPGAARACGERGSARGVGARDGRRRARSPGGAAEYPIAWRWRSSARGWQASAPAPRGATISELLERAIAASGYREHVLGLDWGERRLANVHKLLRLARRFEASEGRDLRGFLDHVEHLQNPANSRESDAPVEGVEPDAVRLMSIHAAKGLEFPVVCVADLGRTPHTGVPDLLVDGDRVGLRLVRLDGQKGDSRAGLRGAVRGAPAGRGRGGGQDPVRRDDARTRAAAAERSRRVRALARAAPRRQRDLMAGAGAGRRAACARAGVAPGSARADDRARGGARVRCLLSAPATFGAVLGENADGARAAPAPDPAQVSAPVQPSVPDADAAWSSPSPSPSPTASERPLSRRRMPSRPPPP